MARSYNVIRLQRRVDVGAGHAREGDAALKNPGFEPDTLSYP